VWKILFGSGLVDLEEETGEEVHAGDSNDEQPRDLENRCPKVHHRIVLSCPADGERAFQKSCTLQGGIRHGYFHNTIATGNRLQALYKAPGWRMVPGKWHGCLHNAIAAVSHIILLDRKMAIRQMGSLFEIMAGGGAAHSTSLMPLSRRMILRKRRILMARRTRLLPLTGASVLPAPHSWRASSLSRKTNLEYVHYKARTGHSEIITWRFRKIRT
jgi:hypothetical protein